MKRRQFLKTALAAGVFLAAPVPGGGWFLRRLEAAVQPDLAVVHGPSPATLARTAIEALGGIGRFVSRNDVVVVKPNIGWDRAPEYAANTNPEVVAAVVAACLDAGAKKVKVFDHPVNDARRTYRQSGIAAAAAAAGAEVSFTDDRKFKEMTIGGQTLKNWSLYTEAIEADKFINLPIAKVHGTSSLTLGMKNLMGIMGGWRWRLHQRIDESLVDMTTFVKPTLVVLDAVRILTGNGPQGGRLDDVKKLDIVIAGTDSVSVDAYGATLFGMKPTELGFVRLGHERGLGQMHLGKLQIRNIESG